MANARCREYGEETVSGHGKGSILSERDIGNMVKPHICSPLAGLICNTDVEKHGSLRSTSFGGRKHTE